MPCLPTMIAVALESTSTILVVVAITVVDVVAVVDVVIGACTVLCHLPLLVALEAFLLNLPIRYFHCSKLHCLLSLSINPDMSA